MRILFAIEAFRSGGKERQLIELLKGLRRHPDVEVEVVTFDDEVAYEEFHALGFRHRILPRRLKRDPSMFLSMWRVLRDFRPDIIHSWSSLSSVYLAPLAPLAGAKLVNGFLRNAPPKVRVWEPLYLRNVLTAPFASAIVANSRAGLRAFRVSPAQGRCIHNGFDASRLARRRPTAAVREELGITTRFVVGMVAAFADRKDYDCFLEAARRVCDQRDDVTFLAIGGGPTLSRYQQVIGAKYAARIRLLGRRGDVESLAGAFDVGVLCSLGGEGIPNAVMEYMALGKPVVATDLGGTNELVQEGVTGFLTAPQDAAQVTDRVLRLIDDPDLAKSMGEAGKARLASEFSLERLIEDHLALYREVLARA
ncbi:glycosyltransferase [Phenylobacterium soli]|uniref:Glycosyltransferase subfamily 4-like N-terminal domain-containing protein n=1 Tax=Phenylobacterium soli TaxID=2170551 RepID=A0A328AND9_9CAUL|nr:glycosyltransferase [Phenylobacterium soli]RAK56089.1 hypothetical protein DJ017_17020 [Phenylobacterium soli]